jgi:hypothetical protein
MREKKSYVQTSVGKASIWESEGTLCMEFLEKGATNNSEQNVQTLRKLKQQIQRYQPNRKINQVPIPPTIPS